MDAFAHNDKAGNIRHGKQRDEHRGYMLQHKESAARIRESVGEAVGVSASAQAASNNANSLELIHYHHPELTDKARHEKLAGLHLRAARSWANARGRDDLMKYHRSKAESHAKDAGIRLDDIKTESVNEAKSYSLSSAQSFDHVPAHPERTAHAPRLNQYKEFKTPDAMHGFLTGSDNHNDAWKAWHDAPAGYRHKHKQESVDEASVKLVCLECGKHFRSSSSDPRCPKCGGVDYEVDEANLSEDDKTARGLAQALMAAPDTDLGRVSTFDLKGAYLCLKAAVAKQPASTAKRAMPGISAELKKRGENVNEMAGGKTLRFTGMRWVEATGKVEALTREEIDAMPVTKVVTIPGGGITCPSCGRHNALLRIWNHNADKYTGILLCRDCRTVFKISDNADASESESFIKKGHGFDVGQDFGRAGDDTPIRLDHEAEAKPNHVIGYIKADPKSSLGFLRRGDSNGEVRVHVRKDGLRHEGVSEAHMRAGARTLR